MREAVQGGLKTDSTFSRVTFSPISVIMPAKEGAVMDSIEVGARIAASRKKKELTQKQLADLLHVTDKAVSKWECGKNFPDLTLLEALATALDTTPAVLLGLNEKSGDEALSAATVLYQDQRRRWLRELKNRACLLLAYGITLVVVLVWLSRCLDERMIYGLPQALIGVMNGLSGVIIGFAVWAIRSSVKQLRQEAGPTTSRE